MEMIQTRKSLEVISTFTVEEVFEAYRESRELRQKKMMLAGTAFKATSQRLELFFFKGVECVSCALIADFFSLERVHGRNESPHLNLYSSSGKKQPILFTKDHIIPRSLGGPNIFENYETMCEFCNVEKSNVMPSEEKIAGVYEALALAGKASVLETLKATF